MKPACCILAILALGTAGCGHHRAPAGSLINAEASMPAGLPYDPLKWRVITSGVDRRNSAMFTLFGNDPAVDHARAALQSPYPAGSILSLVTWRQQDDPHWFGAKIPARIESIEFISVAAADAKSAPYSYQRFEGAPLKESAGADTGVFGKRINWILNLGASLMP